MIPNKTRYILRASVLAAICASSATALAQQTPADPRGSALAYAQCVRDNGYAAFPDPDAEGGFMFVIAPESLASFDEATGACRHLAPEGMRDGGVTADQRDALVRLSQCVREKGISNFPDPGPKGNYDLRRTGIEPQDTRLEVAIAACADTRSLVRLFLTPWTVAHQAPLSMEFSRQEDWSGLPCPLIGS